MRNWWAQRARWQQIALGAGGAFVALLIISPLLGDSAGTSDAASDTTAVVETTAPTTTAAPTTTEAPTTTAAPTTTEAPTTTAAPTTTQAPTTTAAPANCHSSYPDFCIPPPPPDLNCPDISQKNFTVLQPDPHGFDGNKDGYGCES